MECLLLHRIIHHDIHKQPALQHRQDGVVGVRWIGGDALVVEGLVDDVRDHLILELDQAAPGVRQGAVEGAGVEVDVGAGEQQEVGRVGGDRDRGHHVECGE